VTGTDCCVPVVVGGALAVLDDGAEAGAWEAADPAAGVVVVVVLVAGCVAWLACCAAAA
jgi:hypothetical protein